MTKSREAKQLFEKNFNCAQSTLFTLGKDYFKDEKNALKLATGFGGGIAFRGEMCGAVSGVIMAIGLHFGQGNDSDSESKERCEKICKEFLEIFEKQHGSVRCKNLINNDLSTSEGRQAARQSGVFNTVCPSFVENSVEIFESLLQKYS